MFDIYITVGYNVLHTYIRIAVGCNIFDIYCTYVAVECNI